MKATVVNAITSCSATLRTRYRDLKDFGLEESANSFLLCHRVTTPCSPDDPVAMTE